MDKRDQGREHTSLENRAVGRREQELGCGVFCYMLYYIWLDFDEEVT